MKSFSEPKPHYIDRGESKSRNLKRASIGKVHREQTKLARPAFFPHECLNESHCHACTSYINRLDEWRQKNA